jgi:hypothetical protein
VDGLEDDRTSTVSVFNGPPPEILSARTEQDKQETVADFIRAVLLEGIERVAIGVFVRSRDERPRARAAAANLQ